MNATATTAGAALAELVTGDPALPGLALVLDDERRSAAFGETTTIERVRYKPRASIVAAIRTADGRRWWCASYSDVRKLCKSAERSEKHDAELRRLSDLCLAGALHGDRLLASRIRGVFDDASELNGARVLRYNPLRRVVVRVGDRAVKVSADDAVPLAARRLAALGTGVLPPEQVGAGAWAYEWWGAGDASEPALATADVLTAAGASLARIHGASIADLPMLDAAAQASQATKAIGALLPALRPRAARLAAAVAELRGPAVPSHGDWSPDQILTDGTDVRIIDLDRATLAPREHDLGSYLAAGGDPVLLDGYIGAGGRIDRRALASWTAFGILRRATEPFRTGDPAWPHRIEHALERAERISREGEQC